MGENIRQELPLSKSYAQALQEITIPVGEGGKKEGKRGLYRGISWDRLTTIGLHPPSFPKHSGEKKEH